MALGEFVVSMGFFRIGEIGLKNHLILLALAFVVSSAVWAAPKNKQYRGELSDELCGLTHPELMQDARQCTIGCIRGGGRYVLVNRNAGVVYDLFGKTIPEVLAGRWNKRKRPVRVYTIAPDNG